MLGRLIGNGLVLPASHTSNITGHVDEGVSDDIIPSYSLFPTSSHQKSGVDLNLATVPTGSTMVGERHGCDRLEGRWEKHGLYDKSNSCPRYGTISRHNVSCTPTIETL